MAGKFQIRTRKWDIGILIGALAALALSLGGLFLLQGLDQGGAGGPALLLVVVLGLVTFGAFAGPGIVYALRKRVKAIGDRVPGKPITWIRAHMYLPVVALVAAYAHAVAVPFRGHLSSGKVLLVLGILVSIAGLARHHLLGLQKAALNVDVAISKLATGQPRAFRRIVADFTNDVRPVAELDAMVAQLPAEQQQLWSEIRAYSAEFEKHFPRGGGQRWHVRQYKLFRALHAPLTIALFVVLAFHLWDVFGATRTFVSADEVAFPTASECADCHGDIFDEWKTSTMSHALTSTINEAQLPLTLSENVALAELIDGSDGDQRDDLELLIGRDLDDESQEEFALAVAHICIDCHGPVGGSFADDPLALLPFDGNPTLGRGEGLTAGAGNDAVLTDGVSCVVCHSSASPPVEREGNGAAEGDNPLIADSRATLGGYATVYGPPFRDPNPLPVRIHGISNGEGRDARDYWTDPLETSQLCGACHNVKLDIDGDGGGDRNSIGVPGAEEMGVVELLEAIDDGDDLDQDGDFQLDENELDDDRANDRTAAGDVDEPDGKIDDLVLQTTYDEWQDYIAFFDVPGGFTDRYADAGESTDGDPLFNDLSRPLGCTECHMPLAGDDDVAGPVVDYAPGLLSRPDRFRRQHTFVGVDYDLDPSLYRKSGLSDRDIARIVAERDALIQSAASLEVVLGDVIDTGNGDTGLVADVVVRNNLLAHSFPTGFAFARQFWIEVSAETSDGRDVCLTTPFFTADGSPVGSSPCASGVDGVSENAIDAPIARDDELRQCDNRAYDELIGDTLEDEDVFLTFPFEPVGFPNLGISFAEGGSFGPEECDPWLANFQKILTEGLPRDADGDPILDGTGTLQEIPYQPLLPNAVQIRGRLVNGQLMNELQPVRLRGGEEAAAVSVPYVFDVTGLDPDDVIVTARLRFRHLPPYFVRDLERRQRELGNDVPEGARLSDEFARDADELLEHMVVGEVARASSEDDGPVLTCPGPQNGETTILDCVDQGDIDRMLVALNLGADPVDPRAPIERPATGGGRLDAVLPEARRPQRGTRRARPVG